MNLIKDPQAFHKNNQKFLQKDSKELLRVDKYTMFMDIKTLSWENIFYIFDLESRLLLEELSLVEFKLILKF